jgi:hypothetical protein
MWLKTGVKYVKSKECRHVDIPAWPPWLFQFPAAKVSDRAQFFAAHVHECLPHEPSMIGCRPLCPICVASVAAIDRLVRPPLVDSDSK